MKIFKLASVVFVIVMLLVTSMPAGAVTDGQPDGGGHPFVGIMVGFDEEGPAWSCSGTLISPTVFLTAGHCVDGAVGDIQIWFDADVEAGYPANGFPWTGSASGTGYLYPEYNFPLGDVGVVILNEAVDMPVYGQLPSVNQLDALKTKRGVQDVTFTAVGYGMQKSFPDAAAWKNQGDYVRMVAYPHLIQINVPGFTGNFSLLLSNNAATGGTCFGDSGGPNFLGNTNIVAGVTSFGINGNCAGTGGVFRMDRKGPLEWVQSFLK